MNTLPESYSSLWENNGNNQTIKSEGFSENENQNHSDEDLLLLSVSSNSCITNDSNGETGSLYVLYNRNFNSYKWWKTAAKSGSEMLVTKVISVAIGINYKEN